MSSKNNKTICTLTMLTDSASFPSLQELFLALKLCLVNRHAFLVAQHVP